MILLMIQTMKLFKILQLDLMIMRYFFSLFYVTLARAHLTRARHLHSHSHIRLTTLLDQCIRSEIRTRNHGQKSWSVIRVAKKKESTALRLAVL
jgi:hypothetical protein